MRDWFVAGGLVADADRLLLVENERRNGSRDWSTPGGVVDEGESALEGLTREVLEETGLAVQGWSAQLYTVAVDFIEMEMTLRVEAYKATTWTGELVIDDPDGIVVGAKFLHHADVREHLATSPQWVSEPLLGYLEDPTQTEFRYRVDGSRDTMSVARL